MEEVAGEHTPWNLDDYSRVDWSDGIRTNRLGSYQEHWVWQKPGSALRDPEMGQLVGFREES